MNDSTGSSRARRRWRGLAAASAGLGLTFAVAAFDEAPAVAQEPAASFETAFASLKLTQAEARPSAATALAAQTRFEQAPVEPEAAADPIGTGRASYYGDRFAGRPTASGERFNPSALTAAHRTLPFGTKVKVTNVRNGQSVVVRINDRGPFHGNRVIDLSREAARQIGIIGQGHGQVQLASLAS